MPEPIFTNGIPARITVQDFKRFHLQSFPRLSSAHDEIIEEAIEAVYAMFSGVSDIWSSHEKQTWYDKTVLCYRLLTAWYIADIYPAYLSGLPTMGGIPLKRKKIGPVDITFQDNAVLKKGNSFIEDNLLSLKSNPFGMKAYLMIRSCAKRTVIIGGRTL